jgi:hypothetical protein
LAEVSTAAGGDNLFSMSSLMKEGADLSISLTAEMTLAILGAASEVAGRAVLLLVYPGYLSGIGGFGETSEGGQVNSQEIRVPRHLPSVFNTVADTAQVMRGPLDSADGNAHFLDELGGRSDGDAVVIPLTVSNTVVAVLYADGGLDGGKLDATSILEGVVAGIGRSLET